MKREVVILGGGFAGLAAGVALAERGHQVNLFERRGHLGGRAYSFRDPATGSLLDNGQHIFMGCYEATLRFLKKIGTEDKIRFQKNLTVCFAGPGQRVVRFRAWPLPKPWHLFLGMLLFPGFSFQEKWSFAKLPRRVRADSTDLDQKSVPEWLKELGQGEKVRSRFWDLLAFAALNDAPKVCSAAAFRPVLVDALFSGRKASRIGLARGGLSDLYAEPAREFIEKKGGRVFLKTPAVKLHFSNQEFREVELEGGRRIAPDTLIVAVPFGGLERLLPEEMLYHDPFFHPIRLFRSSPIATVNLWFDRDFVPADFVGFWDTRIHWLFNRGKIIDSGPPCYSLVISGAREEMRMPGPELIRIALEELGLIFPEMSRAKLLHSHVMKEPEATLSPGVGVNSLRLPQKTPYQGLYLAGDWTDTGLPATIEGAVRSAYRVVDLIERGE